MKFPLSVCVLQHNLSAINFPLFLKPHKHCAVFPIYAHKSALERSSSLHIYIQTYICTAAYIVIRTARTACIHVVVPANFKCLHFSEKRRLWTCRDFVECKKLNCCKVNFIQALKCLYACAYLCEYFALKGHGIYQSTVLRLLFVNSSFPFYAEHWQIFKNAQL